MLTSLAVLLLLPMPPQQGSAVAFVQQFDDRNLKPLCS
jgi:hypothetical protein